MLSACVATIDSTSTHLTQDEGMPAEMTEEEQLQTAIRVSLERRESHSQDPYQLNGDSDECVSLCSGDEAEAIELGREELDDGSFREGTFTRTAAASGADICILSDLKRTNPRGNGSLSTNMNSRKRKSSTSEDTSVPSQKMARFQEPTFHSQPCHGPLGRKGKESAATGVVAVEEKLRTGELHKDEVSEVVVRLPDGTRLQKAFLGSSPIKVGDQLRSAESLLLLAHFIKSYFIANIKWFLLCRSCTVTYLKGESTLHMT